MNAQNTTSTPTIYDQNRNRVRFISKSTTVELHGGSNTYTPADPYPSALKSSLAAVTGVEVSGARGCEHTLIRRVYIEHLLRGGYSVGDIRRNTDRRMGVTRHAKKHTANLLRFGGYRALVDMLGKQVRACLRGVAFERVNLRDEIATAKNADGRQWSY